MLGISSKYQQANSEHSTPTGNHRHVGYMLLRFCTCYCKATALSRGTGSY